MTSITIETDGRRAYIVGETYPHRSAIKDAGGHWDGERKAWWLGSRAKAEELVAHLCGSAATTKQPPNSDEPAGECLRDDDRVVGRAEYKGRSYLLVWEGQTKRGMAAKLAYADGSRVFWAGLGEIRVTKRYREPNSGNRRGYGRIEAMTFGRLRRLQEDWRGKTPAERDEAARVAELGGRCRCERPLDEGDGECMTCGYFICGEA